jgi:hypothetical protein
VPDGYKGSLTTAGYPGDKPLWSFWRIPGGSQCVVTDKDGSDSVMVRPASTSRCWHCTGSVLLPAAVKEYT